MSAGMKKAEQGIFHYLRLLLSKRKALSIVEVVIVFFILIILLTALVFSLTRGQFSFLASSTKLELQSEVRKAMDWMVKDLRQTHRAKLMLTGDEESFVALDMNSTFTDPIFPLCNGFDGSEIIWGNDIGYSFDGGNQQIIRTDYGTGQTWVFKDISGLTFEKLGDNLLKITITGTKTFRGTIAPTVSLETEVKLRND